MGYKGCRQEDRRGIECVNHLPFDNPTSDEGANRVADDRWQKMH